MCIFLCLWLHTSPKLSCPFRSSSNRSAKQTAPGKMAAEACPLLWLGGALYLSSGGSVASLPSTCEIWIRIKSASKRAGGRGGGGRTGCVHPQRCRMEELRKTLPGDPNIAIPPEIQLASSQASEYNFYHISSQSTLPCR